METEVSCLQEEKSSEKSEENVGDEENEETERPEVDTTLLKEHVSKYPINKDSATEFHKQMFTLFPETAAYFDAEDLDPDVLHKSRKFVQMGAGIIRGIFQLVHEYDNERNWRGSVKDLISEHQQYGIPLNDFKGFTGVGELEEITMKDHEPLVKEPVVELPHGAVYVPQIFTQPHHKIPGYQKHWQDKYAVDYTCQRYEPVARVLRKWISEKAGKGQVTDHAEKLKSTFPGFEVFTM